MLDETATIEAATELRDIARVFKQAIGVLLAYWKVRGDPPEHPYRQAATMVLRYLERRYGV